jgi:DNA-binding FadR family transcriptional regulator
MIDGPPGSPKAVSDVRRGTHPHKAKGAKAEGKAHTGSNGVGDEGATELVEIPRLQALRAPEVLAQYLREQILNDRFPVGTPLPPERELGRQSGFGRSTVREAIKILGAEGLVAADGPDRRLVVAEPTTQPVRRVFESYVRVRRVSLESLIQARAIIEPECSALAAEMGDEDALDRVRTATDALDEVTVEEETLFLLRNAEWHRAIAAATGNPILEMIVDVVISISFEGSASFYRRADDMSLREGVHKAHHKILAAIERGDSAEARRSMQRHLKGYHEFASAHQVLDRSIEVPFGRGPAKS